MREEITRVYKFDELTDAAKERAIEAIREKLGSDWWDSADNDGVEATMVSTLAENLRTPGWDTHGVGDFPGIDGVQVDGWDIGRHQALAVSGTLTRETAPGLPWVDGIDHIALKGYRSDSTTVDLVEADPDCTCSPDHYLDPHDAGCPALADNPATAEQRVTLEEAVRDVLSGAWSAGEKEAEYKTGEERAREVADNHEFTEDGLLY